MGARIALNASPLPVVVTAQKPRRFADLAGFRFGQHQKRAAIIPDSRRALEIAKPPILSS